MAFFTHTPTGISFGRLSDVVRAQRACLTRQHIEPNGKFNIPTKPPSAFDVIWVWKKHIHRVYTTSADAASIGCRDCTGQCIRHVRRRHWYWKDGCFAKRALSLCTCYVYRKLCVFIKKSVNSMQFFKKGWQGLDELARFWKKIRDNKCLQLKQDELIFVKF